MLRLVKDIDENTGELRRQKEQHISDTFNTDGYRVPGHKLGAKMFSDVEFPGAMSHAEIGKMAILAKLMISDSNMIGYRARGCIRAYTEKQMIRIVGLSDRRGKEFIEKMIRLAMMQRVIRQYAGKLDITEYYINPAYFFAGKRLSLNLYLLFRESLNPILTPWVKAEFLRAAAAEVKPT